MSQTYIKLPFAFVSPGEVLAAGIVFPVIGILSVALRFYTRKVQKASIGTDDWLIIPAVILITGMGACLITGVALGIMGYPTPLPPTIDPSASISNYISAYETEAKIEFAFQLMMILAYGFVKLSIIFFCRRIFLVNKGSKFDIASTMLIVISVCWTILFFLWFLFGCRNHIDLHWSPLGDISRVCGNPLAPEMGLVISDFITDLFILSLPIPMIWTLNMSASRKIAASAIFLIGLIAIAASIARMTVYIIVTDTGLTAGYDLDQTVTTMLWWSMVEAGTGLLTACLPTLRFLLKGVSLQAFLNSIRSITAWRSLVGRYSTFDEEKTYQSGNPDGSNSQLHSKTLSTSDAPLIHGTAPRLEVHAMRDMSQPIRLDEHRPDQIHVRRSIDQDDGFV